MVDELVGTTPKAQKRIEKAKLQFGELAKNKTPQIEAPKKQTNGEQMRFEIDELY